ncbi:unnamed protein product [Phytophthora fragariaefolia]|uniref:Unnamed protein product n=1 Tax=Phytophthora fragariaefolia TaxID=1490495 RepID=A0A9W7D8Q9_9STRA|nr:unnamed protein product [Phytophthora fragariaefolia]
MVDTRPDLALYTRDVSQLLINPGTEYRITVARGFKYLSGIGDHDLLRGGSKILDRAIVFEHLIAYKDSDNANSPDTGRSAGGYSTMIDQSPIS